MIYDHPDFLSGGNFQANMQAKSSESTELRRQKSEFRETEIARISRGEFGEEKAKQSKNSNRQ